MKDLYHIFRAYNNTNFIIQQILKTFHSSCNDRLCARNRISRYYLYIPKNQPKIGFIKGKGTYPFHPQTIHPWALILSFTSYKFQLYKIIPYSLAYAYHTFSVILYYIDSFHFILYLSSSPFHTFEFIFLMPYYYFSSL